MTDVNTFGVHWTVWKGLWPVQGRSELAYHRVLEYLSDKDLEAATKIAAEECERFPTPRQIKFFAFQARGNVNTMAPTLPDALRVAMGERTDLMHANGWREVTGTLLTHPDGMGAVGGFRQRFVRNEDGEQKEVTRTIRLADLLSVSTGKGKVVADEDSTAGRTDIGALDRERSGVLDGWSAHGHTDRDAVEQADLLRAASGGEGQDDAPDAPTATPDPPEGFPSTPPDGCGQEADQEHNPSPKE